MKFLLLIGPLFFVSGCTFFEPKPVVKYDSDCQIYFQQYTLGVSDNPGQGIVLNDNNILISANYYSLLRSCSNNGCLELIRDLMQALAIDTLFAGSVAIAGNTLSWMQKEKDCKEIEPRKNEVIEEDLGNIS